MYNTRLKSRNLVHCKTLQHKVKTFDIFWFLEVNTVSVYKNQFNTGCYSPVCGAGVCLASVFYRPWLIISYTETSDTTPGHKQGPNKSCHALHQTAPHTNWRTRCNCHNVFQNCTLVHAHASPCWSITVWTDARLKRTHDAQAITAQPAAADWQKLRKPAMYMVPIK